MGTYAATAETNYTWSNIGPGQHKFSVELVNNDQTPLNPPVTANIAVQVAAQSGPSVAVILSPRTNAVIAGNSVTIAAQAANFKLVDAAGQADAVNEGHLYYFMDVEAPTTTMTPGAPIDTAAGTFAATSNTSYTWQNVPPGVHTFSIELVNNDGTPTNPPVTSKIAVIVRGASPASGNPPASGPALSFIAVTPLLQNTLQPGNSRQFNAIGIYSDNSEQDLASQVTWTSSEPAIASISTTGLATSVAGGITAITASLSGVTSPSVTLNVYAPTGG
jgi:hypothetical protein